MALEYIPWLVGGGVAAAGIAGCTAVCTVRYSCNGKNDSSKDQAKLVKKDITKQHVKNGVVLTDTIHTIEIQAANVDTQTMLSNTLEQKESQAANAIAAKDIGGLTVAGLMNAASSVVGSAVGAVSNFFSDNSQNVNINAGENVNINAGQNVVISSGDNILNTGDTIVPDVPDVSDVPYGGEYEVNLEGSLEPSATLETIIVDEAESQGFDNLNKLAERGIDTQEVNNQFIDAELSGEEV